MSNSNSRYVLIQWALPFLLGAFWVAQAGGIAQASAVNAANTAFMYQQGQSFKTIPNLLLAKLFSEHTRKRRSWGHLGGRRRK